MRTIISNPAGAAAIATLVALGICKPDGKTLTIAPDGTQSAVYMAITPRAFGAITDGGVFNDGGKHPASTNGYPGTPGKPGLAELQVVYPFATALSDEMSGLMIQAAINHAHDHKYPQVLLDAGIYRNIPTGLVFPLNTSTRLIGAVGRSYTEILCSPCGSNPAFTANSSGDNADGSVEGITFSGFDAKGYGDPSTPSAGSSPGNTRRGVPDPMLYTAGSIGMRMSNCYYMTFRNLTFRNFDRCLDFSATGNNYLIAYEECIFELNNVGPSIERYGAINSYEKMSFRRCVIGNNNIGALIIFGDEGSNGVAGDVTFYDCSFDYNVQWHIKYIGAQKYINTRQNCVRVIGGHMETNSDTSGGGAGHWRVYNNGDFRMFGVEIAELGDLPTAFAVHADNAAATDVRSCRTTTGRFFPCVDVGNSLGLVTGGDNGGMPLVISATGKLYTPTTNPDKLLINSNITLFSDLDNSLRGPGFLVTASCSITIPADGSDNGNFAYMANTGFVFRTLPGVTCTFVPSGCRIDSSGTGLSFGGAKPAEVTLINTTGSSWIATGQMT